MNPQTISPDMKTVLRRLKLGRMLDTLPERFVLARKQKMPHEDFLLLVLGDEASRRDSQAVTLRVTVDNGLGATSSCTVAFTADNTPSCLIGAPARD